MTAFQRTYLYLKRSIETLLSVTFLLGVPLSVSAEKGSDVNRVKICIAGEVFHAPLISNLFDLERYDRNSIAYGDKPIPFSEIVVLNESRGTKPIQHSLLGRESDYRVRQLKFGIANKRILDEWPNRHPLFEESRDGKKEFLLQSPNLFGSDAKITCWPNLPIYSKSEDSHSCLGWAVRSSGVSVRFSFFTGSDLDGHWPKPPESSSETDWTAWIAPLRDLEDAINKTFIEQGHAVFPGCDRRNPVD